MVNNIAVNVLGGSPDMQGITRRTSLKPVTKHFLGVYIVVELMSNLTSIL